MMFLPLICLIFLCPQFVFSASKNSSPISGQWSSDCSANYRYSLCDLLETLTSQTCTGMYNFGSTPSNTPNQLHGLYVCRGNVDLETCRSCVQSAKNYILEHMSCSYNGLVWYDHCMLRYSNESFLGKFDANRFVSSSWSGRKIKGSRILFMTILMKTMQDLAMKASEVQNMNKYASTVVELSKYETLNATVQCMPEPDLLAKNYCYRCLIQASQEFLRMDGSVNGQALYTSCMVEYKTSAYYDELSFAALPSSPSMEDINSSLIGINGTSTDDATDTSEQAI